MKNIIRNIFVFSLIFALNCAPTIVATTMATPAPATQTDKQKAAAAKKKEAEKRKKAAEKAKAAKEKQKAQEAKRKETEKQKAAAAKENAKRQAEREKVAAERAEREAIRQEQQAKREAELQAKDEKAKRDYEKYLEEQNNPKTEVISYFNIGLRAGYAAMMDKLQAQDGMLWGSGTLNQNNALQQLVGGPGAGLNLTYNLEYGHFLFETGLDFRYLNSTSNYGFSISRKDNTYGATYNYMFDRLSENRNLLQVGIPVMFGAQFSRYYFLVGANIGYSLWGNYTHKGQYDIVVNDPALLDPYGMGIHDLNGTTNTPIFFKQPEVSIAAEIGIDLDEWLQAQPQKKKQQVKPGQRLPFGREYIHYRVALFAEYGVLNTNNTSNRVAEWNKAAALNGNAMYSTSPVEFGATDVNATNTNTMLAREGSKLNNLFVGAKFIVQFEVPGKKPTVVPPPASYGAFSIVDQNTNEPLQNTILQVTHIDKNRVVVRDKMVRNGSLSQKLALGQYTATVTAENYIPKTVSFSIDDIGTTVPVKIDLLPRPVFRVSVVNAETNQPLAARVQVRQRGTDRNRYILNIAADGQGRTMMDSLDYDLHIERMGFETLDMPIADIGDSVVIRLVPIKKGEVFIMKNMFFATNKTKILSTSEESLTELAEYLTRTPDIRIRIIGHTDNVGKDAANQKLSEGRANAVREDLIKRGIDPARIEAEGRGESQPIDTNETEEGRQNNRRVEIEIL